MLNKKLKDESKPLMRDYIGMFDLSKGFFILMIILGHALTDVTHYWTFDGEKFPVVGMIIKITAFVFQAMIVPFFIMGGYSFRKRKMKQCAKMQFKSFFKPYLYVTLAVAVLTIIKKIVIRGSIVDGLVYQVVPFFLGFCPGKREFLGIFMDTIGPVWFLLVFVLATILLNAIMHEERPWTQVLILVTLTFGGLALKNITLPFCIQQVMICTGYMYVGVLMKKAKFFQNKLPLSFVLIASVISILDTVYGYFAVSENIWTLGIFDVFASYLGGILMLVIFQRINAVAKGKIFEFIRWLGKHIMWFCCVHTVAFLVLPWKQFSIMFAQHKTIGIILECIIHLVIAVIGCYVLDVIMKKSMAKKLAKMRKS